MRETAEVCGCYLSPEAAAMRTKQTNKHHRWFTPSKPTAAPAPLGSREFMCETRILFHETTTVGRAEPNTSFRTTAAGAQEPFLHLDL